MMQPTTLAIFIVFVFALFAIPGYASTQEEVSVPVEYDEANAQDRGIFGWLGGAVNSILEWLG